jgi:hypothetical protein
MKYKSIEVYSIFFLYIGKKIYQSVHHLPWYILYQLYTTSILYTKWTRLENFGQACGSGRFLTGDQNSKSSQSNENEKIN